MTDQARPTVNSRLCVFCGQPPQDKNLEHVVPLWLMEYTGDLGREWNFGFDFNSIKDGEPKEVKHANSSFAFPSCKKCNSDYSDLEGKVRRLFDKLMAKSPLTAREYDVLLDWFDKVRVGVWLGSRYRNKALTSNPPNFHISKRIGLKDRMLLVYKVNPDHKGLTILGTAHPAFMYFPSCFGILCNGMIFISISKEFLLSPRMGFPYPRVAKNLGGLLACEDFQAHYHYKTPFIRKSFPPPVLEIYQPILFSVGMMPTSPDVTREEMEAQIDSLKKLYEHEFIKERLLSGEMAKAKIHSVGNGKFYIHEPEDLIKENDLLASSYRNGGEYFQLVLELQFWLLQTIKPQYVEADALEWFETVMKTTDTIIKRNAFLMKQSAEPL